MQNLVFVSQAGKGLPLLFALQNHGFASQLGGAEVLGRNVGFRHLPHPRSFRFEESAQFDQIKRLRRVWIQNVGLGTQFCKYRQKRMLQDQLSIWVELLIAQIPYLLNCGEISKDSHKFDGLWGFLMICMMLHDCYNIFNRKQAPAAESKATTQ